MSNAYVFVSPTSSFVFTNALQQDVVFFPQSNTQRLLLGVNSNARSTITCASNLTQVELDVLFTSNNINRMIISSNTGIGTSTPRTLLHLQSNVPGGNASLLTLQNTGGGNNTAYASIDFLTWNTVNTQARLSVVDSNFSGAFVFSTKTAGIDTNPLVERMRLGADGDLVVYNTLKTSNASAVATVAPTGFTGDGANITNINANNIATGTLPIARGGTGTTTSTGTGSVVLSAGPTFTGTVTAATINATTLQQGGTAVSLSGHTHDASAIVSGILNAAYLPAQRATIPCTFRQVICESGSKKALWDTPVYTYGDLGLSYDTTTREFTNTTSTLNVYHIDCYIGFNNADSPGVAHSSAITLIRSGTEYPVMGSFSSEAVNDYHSNSMSATIVLQANDRFYVSYSANIASLYGGAITILRVF